jgi:hypothetical protein
MLPDLGLKRDKHYGGVEVWKYQPEGSIDYIAVQILHKAKLEYQVFTYKKRKTQRRHFDDLATLEQFLKQEISTWNV